MSGFPLELLADWPDRWRYPGLLTAGDALTTDSALNAVLRGLAWPLPGPAATIETLVASGDYGAAQELADRIGQPQEGISASREAAALDLARVADGLRRRAARIGWTATRVPDLEAELLVSRSAAEEALKRWTDDIARAEKAHRDEANQILVARLLAEPAEEWADAIRACLTAGEFGAAQRLLELGPDDTAGANPRSVASWPLWPWWGTPMDTVLRWYLEDGALDVPEFVTLWSPSSADSGGKRLMETFAALVDGLTERRARDFASAIDAHLGADGAPHSVVPWGDGFRTALTGLADPRLPWLALPRRVPLYIAGPPPTDVPAIWFHPVNAPVDLADVPPGVAVLDARTVFLLAMPSREGARKTATTRRLNLLRQVCAQLRTAEVIGDEISTGGYEQRGELSWWFDLLSVQADIAVIDTLLYDTAGHPLALRAAFHELLPDENRPRDLTLDDLTRWREDPVRLRSFHDELFRLMDADREVSLVLHAVLYAFGDQPASRFTAEDIEAVLSDWTDSRLDTLVAVRPALDRAVVTGLLTTDGDGLMRWNHTTLCALLFAEGEDGQRQRGIRDLAELRSRRARSSQSAALMLKNRLNSMILHDAWTTSAEVEDVLKAAENAATIEEVHAHVKQARQRLQNNAINDAALNPENIDEALVKTRMNLHVLLRKRCLDRQNHQGPDVTVAFVPLIADAFIWGSRLPLTLAIDSLLHNACRAVDGAGEVRVTLSADLPAGSESGIYTHVLLDIEDTGRGLPPADLELVNAGLPLTTPPLGSGHGITHARYHIDYNGGTIRFAASTELNGLRVHIRLPLTAAQD